MKLKENCSNYQKLIFKKYIKKISYKFRDI